MCVCVCVRERERDRERESERESMYLRERVKLHLDHTNIYHIRLCRICFFINTFHLLLFCVYIPTDIGKG